MCIPVNESVSPSLLMRSLTGGHNWSGFQFGTVTNWNWIGIGLDGAPNFWPIPIGINIPNIFKFGVPGPIGIPMVRIGIFIPIYQLFQLDSEFQI